MKAFALTKTKIISTIIVVFLLIVGITTIGTYNSMIRDEALAEEQYTGIGRVLDQRSNTLTLLANAIVGLQTHEADIYNALFDARAAYASARASNDTEGMMQADADLTSALQALLLAVVEDNGVNLNSAAAYNTYMVSVISLEYELSAARVDYNSSVRQYNTNLRLFPNLIVASLFRFEEKNLWENPDGTGEIPDINFVGIGDE